MADLFNMVTWGISVHTCARAGAEYIIIAAAFCRVRVVYSTVGRTCSKKAAWLALKTRGFGTGATFMRGSYIAEPRLLACVSQVRA